MDALSLTLGLLQVIRETTSALTDLQRAQAKAAAEGRQLSEAELDKFRVDTVLERARLTQTKRPGEA